MLAVLPEAAPVPHHTLALDAAGRWLAGTGLSANQVTIGGLASALAIASIPPRLPSTPAVFYLIVIGAIVSFPV